MLLFCYYDMYVYYVIMIFVSMVILDMSIEDIEEKKEEQHHKENFHIISEEAERTKQTYDMTNTGDQEWNGLGLSLSLSWNLQKSLYNRKPVTSIHEVLTGFHKRKTWMCE